jgi:hypothetical protein
MPNPVVGSEIYNVHANTPVRLTATIGEGQNNGTTVTLDGQPVGSGEIINLRIPKLKPNETDADRNLQGKSLLCTTHVQVTNTVTKRTEVIYKFREGVQDRDFPYETTVENAGEIVVYRASFLFL